MVKKTQFDVTQTKDAVHETQSTTKVIERTTQNIEEITTLILPSISDLALEVSKISSKKEAAEVASRETKGLVQDQLKNALCE